MKNFARLAFLIPASAIVLLAQGPPPGGFGGGPGFGPMGGFGPMHGGPAGGMLLHKVVTGAPFTGTLTEQRQQNLPDGNQISNQTEMKVSRDSQGRVRTESTRTTRNGETHTFVMIFDPVAGFEARLNPDKLTAFKHTLPANGVQRGNRPKPPAGEGPQISSVDLGSKTIEGLVATGKQVTMTLPAGEVGNSQPLQTVREVWTSTALQVPISVTITNPESGTSKMQLTAVTQAEPDASLFQIPSNYKVSTASDHRGGPPPGEGE